MEPYPLSEHDGRVCITLPPKETLDVRRAPSEPPPQAEGRLWIRTEPEGDSSVYLYYPTHSGSSAYHLSLQGGPNDHRSFRVPGGESSWRLIRPRDTPHPEGTAEYYSELARITGISITPLGGYTLITNKGKTFLLPSSYIRPLRFSYDWNLVSDIWRDGPPPKHLQMVSRLKTEAQNHYTYIVRPLVTKLIQRLRAALTRSPYTLRTRRSSRPFSYYPSMFLPWLPSLGVSPPLTTLHEGVQYLVVEYRLGNPILPRLKEAMLRSLDPRSNYYWTTSPYSPLGDCTRHQYLHTFLHTRFRAVIATSFAEVLGVSLSNYDRLQRVYNLLFPNDPNLSEGDQPSWPCDDPQWPDYRLFFGRGNLSEQDTSGDEDAANTSP